MKRPNVDVEETRKQKDITQAIMGNAESVCVALIHEACDGSPSKMLTMLDMITSRIIFELADSFGMGYAEIVETHRRHVHDTILAFERMKK